MREFARALTVLGWLLAAAIPAAGADMSDLMPELRTLPAPPWVKPGGRITYHSAAASVPGACGYFWRKDDGDWEGQGERDKGKRYAQGDQFGIGGEGYTLVDIVALEGNTAGVSVRSFGKHMGNLLPRTDLGALTLGGTGPAGCVGNWWVNPAVLKDAAARFGGPNQPEIVRGVRVMATPCAAANRAFDTLRFEASFENGHTGRNYDLPTGILVHSDSSATSQGQAYTWAGDATALSLNKYEGFHPIAIPWADAPPPGWLATIRRVVFKGTYTPRHLRGLCLSSSRTRSRWTSRAAAEPGSRTGPTARNSASPTCRPL